MEYALPGVGRPRPQTPAAFQVLITSFFPALLPLDSSPTKSISWSEPEIWELPTSPALDIIPSCCLQNKSQTSNFAFTSPMT